eukprot:scaffold1401_cov330-Pavlova_lutheri.AAC.124
MEIRLIGEYLDETVGARFRRPRRFSRRDERDTCLEDLFAAKWQSRATDLRWTNTGLGSLVGNRSPLGRTIVPSEPRRRKGSARKSTKRSQTATGVRWTSTDPSCTQEDMWRCDG